MRNRVSFVAFMLLLGAVAWWALSRREEPAAAREGTVTPGQQKGGRGKEGTQGSNEAKGTEAIDDESVDQSEKAPSDAGPDPARVKPVPRTVKLGAVEEWPEGPAPVALEEAPALPPVTALENFRGALHQFAARHGGNPVGDNAEITAALTGQNSRRATFITPEDGLRVNAQGQAIDSWGTPYFFHQLSRTETEIRSAGPDHRMWTTDDLVLK